jgi:hypothetical protein
LMGPSASVTLSRNPAPATTWASLPPAFATRCHAPPAWWLPIGGNAVGAGIERKLVAPPTYAGWKCPQARRKLISDRPVIRNLAVRLPRSVSAGQTHCSTSANQGRLGTKAAVGETVKSIPVPAVRFDDDRNKQVVHAGICGLQGAQRHRFGNPRSGRG